MYRIKINDFLKNIYILTSFLLLHLRIYILEYIVHIHVLYRMNCNNFVITQPFISTHQQSKFKFV